MYVCHVFYLPWRNPLEAPVHLKWCCLNITIPKHTQAGDGGEEMEWNIERIWSFSSHFADSNETYSLKVRTEFSDSLKHLDMTDCRDWTCQWPPDRSNGVSTALLQTLSTTGLLIQFSGETKSEISQPLSVVYVKERKSSYKAKMLQLL